MRRASCPRCRLRWPRRRAADGSELCWKEEGGAVRPPFSKDRPGMAGWANAQRNRRWCRHTREQITRRKARAMTTSPQGRIAPGRISGRSGGGGRSATDIWRNPERMEGNTHTRRDRCTRNDPGISPGMWKQWVSTNTRGRRARLRGLTSVACCGHAPGFGQDLGGNANTPRHCAGCCE